MDTSKRLTGLASLALLAPLAGCATISPPPAAMALEGASQGPVGATAVTVFGGASAGVFLTESVGGGARVAHRISDTVAVGVDGVAGAAVDHGGEQVAPRRIFMGRGHLQVNPGASRGLALTFGVGGGASDNSLSYVTVDAGARISRRWYEGFFEPYVGGLVALSVPTATPDGATRDGGNDRRILPTAYVGIDAGIALHPTARLDVAFDLLTMLGYSASSNAFIMTPTLGVRYAFGGDVVVH
ncbi:MAG: hypothetical protein JWM10_1992 [Myxococcaceae bacterium]|nr:hypothetical protein [Myxococcaceae bacterium]